MKSLITLENYEAFYLDYLEGNLSNAERAAFESFLNEHPELQLEDDFLPELLPLAEKPELTSVEKMALKRDYNDEAIVPANMEGLLIADTEGLLDARKQEALQKFLAKNPVWKQEADLYARTQLQPDLTEQMDKTSLYRKGGGVIPLWWTGVAAMAAGVALFVTLGIGDGPISGSGTSVAFSAKMPRFNTQTGDTAQAHHTGTPFSRAGNKQHTDQELPAPHFQKPTQQPPLHNEPLPSPNNLANNDGSLPPVLPGPNKVTLDPEVKTDNQDLAFAQTRMSNPIAMITGVLSEKLNTPIDLKTAKKTKEEKGGFYLKIGKLEISHTGRKR